MDLNVNIDLAKLKALPRPLKVVAGVILFDLLLVALALLAFSDMVDERQARVDQLRGELSRLRHQSAELRKDINEYPDLLARYNDAAAKGIFSGLDRLKLVNEVQDYAGQHHLANLHYKLEAEKLSVSGDAKYRLDSTIVTLENGALLDTDATAFWDRVFDRLPTHYQVAEASLERMHDIDQALLGDIRSGRAASAVAAKIIFRTQSLVPTAQERQ